MSVTCRKVQHSQRTCRARERHAWSKEELVVTSFRFSTAKTTQLVEVACDFYFWPILQLEGKITPYSDFTWTSHSRRHFPSGKPDKDSRLLGSRANKRAVRERWECGAEGECAHFIQDRSFLPMKNSDTASVKESELLHKAHKARKTYDNPIFQLRLTCGTRN